MRACALISLVVACSQPRVSAPPATPPAAPVLTNDHQLTERDGTQWVITLGPTTSSPNTVSRVYIVTRQARGAEPVEIGRLRSTGWYQTNPSMSGGSDWRFFLAADGTFRTEQRTNETRAGVMTSHVTATLRFDGTQLFPDQPNVRTLSERDGTTWTISDGPSASADSHQDLTYVVVRTAPGGPPVEIARLQGGSSFQQNPPMSSSTDWRFYAADDGTFRAEQTISEQLNQAVTTTVITLRFDGEQLVRVP